MPDQMISYFPNINRTAMVIKPKEPFFNWLNNLNSEVKFRNDFDYDVYLLPDFDEIAEIEEWLSVNYDIFFCDQLNNWYTDDAVWVQHRTFDLFKEWFDYSLHTMVWDTSKKPFKRFG